MHHIAIMQKSWGRISPADTIYFKNSGEPITIQAEVEKVLYFSDLTPGKVQTILEHYGKDMGIEEPDIPKFFELFKHKRYSILIYLKLTQRIQPFEINKQAFGTKSSWICVEHISRIKS